MHCGEGNTITLGYIEIVHTVTHYVHYYKRAFVCARALFEEGGSLRDLKLKIFLRTVEKYFRHTTRTAEFFRTSSKYLPLCRMSLKTITKSGPSGTGLPVI